MAIANPYQQYQQQSVMTASPGELTLMLFNGCIKFTNQAKLAITEKHMEKAGNAIIRVQDIIQELMLSLKPDYDISGSLYSLYEYIYNKLVDANISKDIKHLDEALAMVTELRDTWAAAVKLNRKQAYGG